MGPGAVVHEARLGVELAAGVAVGEGIVLGQPVAVVDGVERREVAGRPVALRIVGDRVRRPDDRSRCGLGSGTGRVEAERAPDRDVPSGQSAPVSGPMPDRRDRWWCGSARRFSRSCDVRRRSQTTSHSDRDW